MTTDPVIVLAASPRAWSGRLRAHAADHGGVLIRATVLTRRDALEEQCAVIILDDITSFLSPSFVQALQEEGRAVLGVYDPGDAQSKGDLVDAGVDALIELEAEPADFVAQIHHLARRQPEDRAPRPRVRGPVSDQPRGRVFGLLGPVGGVGITEVAIEMAAQLSGAGASTLLVDADESAPSLAQRLAAPVHPNIHTALHAVERSDDLTGLLHPLASRAVLRVLPGMANAEDWTTVREGTTTQLLGTLGGSHRAVVVDLGHCSAVVQGSTGLRFGHALGLAGRCDDLVVIAAPHPISIARTIELVARLKPLRRRMHLVLNRVGKDRFARDESVAELRRATGATQVHVIQEDDAVGKAAWQGSRVPRGRFRRQVGQAIRTIGSVNA